MKNPSSAICGAKHRTVWEVEVKIRFESCNQVREISFSWDYLITQSELTSNQPRSTF